MTEGAIVKATVVSSNKATTRTRHNLTERRRVKRLNEAFQRLANALDLGETHSKLQILEHALTLAEKHNIQTLLQDFAEDTGM